MILPYDIHLDLQHTYLCKYHISVNDYVTTALIYLCQNKN